MNGYFCFAHLKYALLFLESSLIFLYVIFFCCSNDSMYKNELLILVLGDALP